MKCQGKNHQGKECNYQSLQNDNYCKLHQSYKKMIELKNNNQKVCKNWIRGCWTILDNEFERCLDCRLKEREKEKNLRDKKKEIAIIYNDNKEKNNNNKEINNDNKIIKNVMCLTCNKIVLELKNNKCEYCYSSAYNCNKNRNERDIFFAKLYEYKSGAKKRNIEFKLNDDTCFELFNKKCFYCNDCNDFNKINGIDRIDSTKSYEIENCVSCCKQCNFMKNDTNQEKFIKLCEHIATFNKLYNGKLYNDILINTKFGKYSQYKLSADKRNIKFDISKNFFKETISKPCIYCGVSDLTFYKTQGAGGIDRLDSNNDYIESNCVPCCGMCNQMKLDYTKDEFLNKCLQITNNQKTESSKILIETKLINTFYKSQNIIRQKKKKFNHSKEYYENKIWNGNISDIKIKIIIVDNNDLNDIWNYYKCNVSSLKLTETSHLVGRQIYLFVADEITNKYLGIISLSSDYLNLSDRDDFIGWTKDQKINEHKLNYIMNISTCVPLQPFGFNFAGGKLLTKLVFSEEIQNIFKEKYNHPLLGITTTSLYGKSIQYDRLKEIKLIGYTKGNSVYKFPQEFVQECKKYLKDYYNISLNKKLYTISTTLQKLELPRDEFMKDIPKGIYFGFVYPDSKDYLCNKIDKIKDYKLKSINEIFNDWLNRWANQRYNHLLQTNKIKEIIKNSSLERTKKCLQKLKDKIGEKEYKKNKNEYMKNYRNQKKTISFDIKVEETIEPIQETTEPIQENIVLNSIKKPDFKQIPDLAPNFSLYKEKESWYLSYSKKIDTIRYNKKNILKCLCIQTELNRLINDVNEKYSNLKIENYIIKNPYDFVDKKPLKEPDDKLKMPKNFSICTINGVKHIQFCKKIDGKRRQYKITLKSDDIPKELNKFIEYLNTTYKLEL